MNYTQPYARQLNPNGTYSQPEVVTERRLRHMRGMFVDSAAEAALSEGDPLIYHVYYGRSPAEVTGDLGFCTTVLYPGKVGDEYFMTKGHFHAQIDRAEVYHCVSGEGRLVLQTPEGEVSLVTMTAGVTAYVPPYWAHRTVNVGAVNFVFLAVYPADAGYNYGIIEEMGFAQIVVERDGVPTAIANPRYGAA